MEAGILFAFALHLLILLGLIEYVCSKPIALSVNRPFCYLILNSLDALVVGLLFITYLYFEFVDVVFKVTFAFGAIWEHHFSVAVLDAFNPLSLVAAAVSPVHLSVAVSLVFSVFTFVDVSTCPLENTVALLPVIFVIAFKAVAKRSFCTAPLALSLFHATSKITNICGTIDPGVLPLAFWFTIKVFTSVGVSI